MSAIVDEILRKRRLETRVGEHAGKFFSVLLGDGVVEHFLELRFRNGLLACFSYADLIWFSYDPDEGRLDLEIGCFSVLIRGRGLRPLFEGIKNKRAAWIQEAGSALEDHQDNDHFIEAISVSGPEGPTTG